MLFFFFKQKTAYEMRISDWSSDVCFFRSFIVMYYQGINANIMSLGGIAIAIGAMVDAAIVMIENAHKHIEAWHKRHPDSTLKGQEHWKVLTDAAVVVGPALFFRLLIITLPSIPVYTLEAKQVRLFGPRSAERRV